MKKTISLILCGVLIICCFIGCEKTYNLNEYTKDEIIPDGYIEIKEGSIITYKGVVTSFKIGYEKNGDKVYFYKIEPIYKGSNSKYASESFSGLIVLSPLEEVNEDFLNFINYLEIGDIVNVKGRKCEDGKYHTFKEPEENNMWRYIKAEEIEVIGNVND